MAKAAPDGYTLLMAYVSHATNPTLNKTLPYDTLGPRAEGGRRAAELMSG